MDHHEDIKAAMSKVKKQNQKKTKRKKGMVLQMDDDEFKETGGMMGYMERARNLIAKQQIGSAKV